MQLPAPSHSLDANLAPQSTSKEPQDRGRGVSAKSGNSDFRHIFLAQARLARTQADTTADRTLSKRAALDEGDADAIHASTDSSNETSNCRSAPQISHSQSAEISVDVLASNVSLQLQPDAQQSASELGFSPTSGATVEDGNDSESSHPAGASSVDSPGSLGEVRGRPFVEQMPMGRAQAAYRAFGMNGAGRSAAAATSETLAVGCNTPQRSVGADDDRGPARTAGAKSLADTMVTGGPVDGKTIAPEASLASEVESTSVHAVDNPVDEFAPTYEKLAVTESRLELSAASTRTEESVSDTSLRSLPTPAADFAVPPELLPSAQVERLGAAVDPAAEKFAVLGENVAEESLIESKIAVKRPLVAINKPVTKVDRALGINAAKTESLMPANVFNPDSHASAAAIPISSFDPSTPAFAPGVKEAGENDTQFEHVANRAVESALAVAEQFAPGERRSVRLTFDVGGQELAVRVELRGELVHTTFRTDSPELRAVLAHEWQAASADRSSRLADPVFASASSNSSFSSDSGSAHQRNQDTRHSQFDGFQTADAHRMLRAQPAPSMNAVPANSPLRPQQSTSRQLHTFA